MGTIKKVSQLIMFTAIIALVFGTGSLTTESLAQEEKNNQGKGVKPDKPDKPDKPNAKPPKGAPLDEDTTFCFGLSITEWRALGTHTVIVGTDGNDRLKGKGEPEVIVGGPGNDVITAAGDDDVVCGGPGDDKILGGGGDDQLDGGPDEDIVKGGDGEDLVIGGPGEDELRGGEDDDLIQAQDLELDNIHGGNPKSDTDTCEVDEVEEKIKGCEVTITPYVGLG